MLYFKEAKIIVALGFSKFSVFSPSPFGWVLCWELTQNSVPSFFSPLSPPSIPYPPKRKAEVCCVAAETGAQLLTPTFNLSWTVIIGKEKCLDELNNVYRSACAAWKKQFHLFPYPQSLMFVYCIHRIDHLFFRPRIQGQDNCKYKPSNSSVGSFQAQGTIVHDWCQISIVLLFTKNLLFSFGALLL